MVSNYTLNLPTRLHASHEYMDEMSTIPQAGRQNPGSDKTQPSSASEESIQPGESEWVMSLERALARALQRFGTYDVQAKSGEQRFG